MKIGVMGTGAVGGYLAGCLAHGGHEVFCVGREQIISEISKIGLAFVHNGHGGIRLPVGAVTVSTTGEILKDLDLVLFTVKSTATIEAAKETAKYLSPNTVVVSFQNGVRNVERLKTILPDNAILAAMVPFPIKRLPEATFHRLMSGCLVLERSEFAAVVQLANALNAVGLKTASVANIQDFQWGKLVINLNNALNALLGIPLKDQLESHKARITFAAVIAEALEVVKSAGISPSASVGVHPFRLPEVLRLPDALYRQHGGDLINIGPGARSSMWADLEGRRATEVDDLNGEIVKRAQELGLKAPLNAKLVDMIKAAQESGRGSPKISSDDLAELLGA